MQGCAGERVSRWSPQGTVEAVRILYEKYGLTIPPVSTDTTDGDEWVVLARLLESRVWATLYRMSTVGVQ